MNKETGKHKSKSKIPSVKRIIISHLYVYKKAKLKHWTWLQGGRCSDLKPGPLCCPRGLKRINFTLKVYPVSFPIYILKTKLGCGGWRGMSRNKGEIVVPGSAKIPRPFCKPPPAHYRQKQLSGNHRWALLKQAWEMPACHLFSKQLETRFKSSTDHLDEKSPPEATLSNTVLFLASAQETFPSRLAIQRNGN